MKFAVLLIYELRSLYKTFDNYSKYLIDYYNADIFIICQKQFENDIEKINLFKKYGNKLKIINLYEKPSPVDYFGVNCIKNLSTCSNNFILPSNLQVYINHNEVAIHMRLYANKYDYFIVMRVDSEILFEFPPPKLFEKIPNAIYTFNPQYARGWGSGGGNFIHSKYFLEYFRAYYDSLTDPNIQSISINQETFLLLSLLKKKLNMININKINYYCNDYVTWSKSKLSTTYDKQCNEAHDALALWNKGYRWGWNDNCIDLILENDGII